MDSVFMNHYEKQLYSVFKTFDVDNEEALDRQAVLELCDALQLEDRGAALVDTLFESRPGRVTFAQFRNGLLSVLGGEVPSQPSSAAQAVITSPAPGSVQAAGATTPLQSDDDSSGREAVPKLTFGSKKYGRRSRPPRVDSDLSPRHRVASESRLDGERVKLRTKCKRSSSAMETRGDSTFDDDTLNLDHEQRVNSDRALKLCQGLQMHGVDERFIERIFEESKVDEMSVGEFFVRLNSSLQCSIEANIDGSVTEDINAADVDIVPSDVVVEAWERVGVQKARRLLHELGITVAALRLRDLERTLDEEIQALGSSPGISEARSLLLLAASTLSRLRIEQFQRKLDMVVAERDKLRLDLSEANRRARLLAQDVDENHARIEAELKGRLRAVEARHAEAARTAAEEAAAERERAARAQRELEAEVSRRVDAEARLRADLAACVQRNQELEERNRESESRSAQAERECARLTSEARAAAEREAQRAERERAAGAEAEARVLELRAENQRLRDRADELGAALEARAPAARPAPPAPACWRDETGGRADEPSASLREGSLASEDERIKTDLDQILQAILGKSNGVSHEALCERCSGLADALLSALRAGRGAVRDTAAPSAPADLGALEALRQELAEVKGTHETEKKNLNYVIKELEGSLEQLREEYERCEEYWAGKLQDERDEQRAADERLAELASKVAAYDEQFASALPSVCESALEDQYLQLDAELQQLRRERDEQLGRQAEELAKQKQVIIELEQRVEHQQKQLQHQQQQLQQKQQQRPGARACTDVDVRTQARAGAACWCGAAGGALGGAGGAAGAGAGAAGGSVREAGALRARAARAERAAQRLHARLAAADLLVKDLYIENCRLAHLPHAPR